MLDAIGLDWPSKRITIVFSVFVSVFLLLVGIFVGPSFIISETTENQLNDVESTALITDNQTEVAFSQDTVVTTHQMIGIGNDSVYLPAKLKYDSDSERVFVNYAPNIESNPNGNYTDGGRVVLKDYYVKNESSGEFETYSLFRVYNASNESWVNVSETHDEEDGACLLNSTAEVEKSTDYLALDDKAPYSSGQIALGQGSEFVELDVRDSDSQRTVSIKEGRYRAKFSAGGFIHITESSGELVATETTDYDGDTVYDVKRANITAKGTFYDGFIHFPVTKWWSTDEFRMSQYTSIDHSENVTVEEPLWVSEYKSSC